MLNLVYTGLEFQAKTYIPPPEPIKQRVDMISSSCSLLIYVSGVRKGDHMLKRMHDSMAYRKNR